MKLRDFALERFFARWEFTAPHMLSASDCEPMTVGELLALAGEPVDALSTLGLGYTHAEGSPWLRERIASFYPGLGPDDVLVTNAPEEAIFLVMSTLVAPGDRMVVLTPCYQALHEIARGRGVDVVAWPMGERDGAWTVDLEALDALLRVPTKLLVVNVPHNPTGWHPSGEVWRAILEVAERHGTRVFSDEMYRGLEREPGARLVPAACSHPRAVSLWGMSKAFGLGGLRIGWLVTQDRAAFAELLHLKDYTTICSSAPSERLAHIALGVEAAITARHRATIAENLEHLRAFGERSGVLDWREPRAGSVVMPGWRPGNATAACEGFARDHGVVLVPGSTFEVGEGHVRFGLGRRAFAEGLAVLERAVIC